MVVVTLGLLEATLISGNSDMRIQHLYFTIVLLLEVSFSQTLCLMLLVLQEMQLVIGSS